ncbi:hypothetical protein D3C85_1182410 [compost metagenome]
MMASAAAIMAYATHVTPISCGSWAVKIRMASALTKPVTTERDTYCISRSSRRKPATICRNPMRMDAANR